MTTIRQLRYFDAVARLGHFGRAAESCAVTQPALSMQIQELEKNLGLALLERRPRGVALTEGGREVAKRAVQILADIRDLGDYARHRSALLTGPLHFGVIPSVAPYVLPQLLPALGERYQDLELHIRESQTHLLVQGLQEGKLDVLLLALPIDHPDIETIRLLEDRFVLAMPRGRDVKGRMTASADLLKGDRLLLLEEGHCLRDQALSFFQLRQIGGIDTFGASSLSTIVQMVANGMGMTLLPEISIGVEAKHDQVRLMRFEEPQPRRTLGLAWRSTSPRKHDFVELGKLIVESVSAGERSIMA